MYRNCMCSGYAHFEPQEPDMPRCPECGEEVNDFYKDEAGDIVGCEVCIDDDRAEKDHLKMVVAWWEDDDHVSV